MLAVLLTIHIIACIALVIAVMLQRSEGGALGMSGGGTGGVISGRGAAGMLVKVTMGLADTIYGVTMQEPGVSKLVSVKVRKDEAPPVAPTGAAVA